MPESTTPDQLAGRLAEVRERHALVTGPESGNWGRLDELHAASYQLSHQDAGCLLAAVEAVLALHAEWRIYEDINESEYLYEEDINESEYLYSVCKECCAASGGGQTEDCAVGHDRAECWPCATVRAISRELPGEGNTSA